jgi:hypothetical protein
MGPDMSVIQPSPDGGAPDTLRGNGPLRRRDTAPAQLFDVSGQPVSPERVRKTRRWMLLLLLTPLCLFGISILAFGTTGPPEPVVHPRVTPRGYQAITDAYFGYAIPSGYTQNTTWTSQNGQFFYGTPKNYVAETESILKTSPSATTPPPSAFRSFGEPTLTGYTAGPAHRIAVQGVRIAFERTITRPGGWHALAVDVWEADTTTQAWLLIHTPAGISHQVIASFQG